MSELGVDLMVAYRRTGYGTTDWFQIGKGGTSRLYIVILLIELICRVHHEKC